MTQITIHKAGDDRTEGFFTHLSHAFHDVKQRAFELFERRNRQPGFELDDWFRAEREIFWLPTAEFTETAADFRMAIDVCGFRTNEISIAATPGEIIVHADAQKRGDNEFEAKSLFRRFTTEPFDPNTVTAALDDGMLTITAPKVAAKPVLVGKSTAPEVSAEKKSGDRDGARAAAA